jgi:hypothetical protein
MNAWNSPLNENNSNRFRIIIKYFLCIKEFKASFFSVAPLELGFGLAEAGL